jgi:hypothetical protein
MLRKEACLAWLELDSDIFFRANRQYIINIAILKVSEPMKE